MKTKTFISIVGLILASPAAWAQAQNNPNRPASVSDQISLTSDYVGSITKNVESLGAQGGGTSADYVVASVELRDRISVALKKFESNIKNMVLLPIGRTIDAYNTTLTQPNLNAEVKKLQLDSKMQVLLSAAATYEASYHRFLGELYQIYPSLVVSGAEQTENSRKRGRAIRLQFADASVTADRFFDATTGVVEPASWLADVVSTPAFGIQFRGNNDETGPFFYQSNFSGNNRVPFRISAKDIDRHVNGRQALYDPAYTKASQLATYFYPDYAYQFLFNTCKRAARGAQPSQTCLTLLRADLQEYYLNIANILDRDMTIMLADGRTVILKGTALDPQAAFYKLIVPSLAGIEYPPHFSSFPASN